MSENRSLLVPQDPDVASLASCPVWCDSALLGYINSPNWLARTIVAMKAVNFRILEVLAHDEDECVRIAVAGNVWTPTEILSYLAKDASADIRAAVAGNESTSLPTLCKLRRDESSLVRERLRANPSRPTNLAIGA